MEIWLNCINDTQIQINSEIDYVLQKKSTNKKYPSIFIDNNNILYKNENKIGKMIKISESNDQKEAISLIGLLEWILIECSDWKMIPCENLIAAAQNSGTKIAAIVEKEVDLQAIAFALEIGVDALVIKPDLVDLATITKIQKLELQDNIKIPSLSLSLNLNTAKINEISPQGIGDRVCIDTTSFLKEGEGLLCGSFAKSLSLIHAETINSEFVPTRPFRINAGSLHSYTIMGDQKTKYLSELKSGDEILIVDRNGASRIVNIGRIKLERRPLIRIKWITKENTEGEIILQQAETVRLIKSNLKPISITKIKINDEILIYNSSETRHIGIPIQAFSQEY
tara:strand:+ start:252 stop:1268 length:1017 start_codon:yes stop_codon:yes gene_type:complete